MSKKIKVKEGGRHCMGISLNVWVLPIKIRGSRNSMINTKKREVVRNIGERIEVFLLGKVTHNQLIDQLNQQIENLECSVKMESLKEDFFVEPSKYNPTDRLVGVIKHMVIMNLEGWLEGLISFETFSEVLAMILATENEKNVNDFEIDMDGNIAEVVEKLNRYACQNSDDSEIKEKKNKRFRSEAQRRACSQLEKQAGSMKYINVPVHVNMNRNLIAHGEYAESSKIIKTYLLVIKESVECEDGFIKGADGFNYYPTRMTLACLSDWTDADEENFHEFEAVSFTESDLDSEFRPSDPRFNYYACSNGLILEVCYRKKGLHMVLTNSWGKYSDSSPSQQAKRYIAPSCTNNRTYLVHPLINAAFPIFNFFSEKYEFEAVPDDEFQVHHINRCAWDNEATNLIELPLAVHRYVHNKASFEALTADPRYSTFHLNLIKLLKAICEGHQTKPLDYFLDNGLI